MKFSHACKRSGRRVLQREQWLDSRQLPGLHAGIAQQTPVLVFVSWKYVYKKIKEIKSWFHCQERRELLYKAWTNSYCQMKTSVGNERLGPYVITLSDVVLPPIWRITALFTASGGLSVLCLLDFRAPFCVLCVFIYKLIITLFSLCYFMLLTHLLLLYGSFLRKEHSLERPGVSSFRNLRQKIFGKALH